MPEKNHYEWLEVSRSASEEDLREQYRLMLYKYHPDHNQGNEDWAVDCTVSLVEAYRTLSDPAARKLYDFKLAHKLRAEGETNGMAFLKKKASKEAEKLFEDGVRFHGRGQVRESMEAFKKALQLDADFTDAAFNLALLAANHGSHHHALELLVKAIQKDPKDAELVKLKNAIMKAFLTA